MENNNPPCPKCSTEGCKIWHAAGEECTTEYLEKRCPECVQVLPIHRIECSKYVPASRTAEEGDK